MGLVRYRYTYFNGDIDRISLQQSFLKSLMEQFISAKNVPNLPGLIKCAKENMLTDLTAGNMAYLAYQLLRANGRNINFYTMPINTFNIYGYSYAVCRVWEWVPMINEYLNPTDDEVGWGHIDMVYHNGEKFAGTQGYLSADWYYDEYR